MFVVIRLQGTVNERGVAPAVRAMPLTLRRFLSMRATENVNPAEDNAQRQTGMDERRRCTSLCLADASRSAVVAHAGLVYGVVDDIEG